MTKEVSEAAADILLDSLSDFHYDRRRKTIQDKGGLKWQWQHTVDRVVNAMARVPE